MFICRKIHQKCKLICSEFFIQCNLIFGIGCAVWISQFESLYLFRSYNMVMEISMIIICVSIEAVILILIAFSNNWKKIINAIFKWKSTLNVIKHSKNTVYDSDRSSSLWWHTWKLNLNRSVVWVVRFDVYIGLIEHGSVRSRPLILNGCNNAVHNP